MNTKHTPGPWEQRPISNQSLVIVKTDSTKPEDWRADHKGCGYVAEIKWERVHGKLTEQDKANAQLIAAAPELLKAAILCRDIADRCNNAMLPDHIQELLKSIETALTEAINKATNQ